MIDDYHRLSDREPEVLTLIAFGKTSREIVDLLGVAFKTAAVHRQHVQKKLDLHRVAGLKRLD